MDNTRTDKQDYATIHQQDDIGGWWGPIHVDETGRCTRPSMKTLLQAGLTRRARELVEENYNRRNSLYHLLGDLGIEFAGSYSRLDLVNAYGWGREDIYHCFRNYLHELIGDAKDDLDRVASLEDAIYRIEIIERYQIGGTSRHYELKDVVQGRTRFCLAAAHQSLRGAVRRNRELIYNPHLETEFPLRFNVLCYCHQSEKSHYEYREFIVPAMGIMTVIRDFGITRITSSDEHRSPVTGHFLSYHPSHVLLSNQIPVVREICEFLRREVSKAIQRAPRKFDGFNAHDAHEAISTWEDIAVRSIKAKKRLRSDRRSGTGKTMRGGKSNISGEHEQVAKSNRPGTSRRLLDKQKRKILSAGRSTSWWRNEIMEAQTTLPENDFESLREWVDLANWYMENYNYRLRTEDRIDCLLRANKDSRAAAGCYLQLTGKDSNDQHRTRGFSQSKVTWVRLQATPTHSPSPSLQG